MAKFKYEIDENTEVEFADCGPWRSFQLYAVGDTVRELRRSAEISEIDQDGGDLNSYELDNASNEVIKAAEAMIETLTGETIPDDWFTNPACENCGHETEDLTNGFCSNRCYQEAKADYLADQARDERDER